jgi:hypothetical protein
LLIISQNLSNYDFPIPENSVYRINLAWINDLTEFELLLKKHSSHKIFLDLPINRTKPPNNSYSLDDLLPILNSHLNIKYLAISNVESKNNLKPYLDVVSKSITLVPKIENVNGISNIKEITDSLDYEEKIIMLDHDDLYSSLTRSNEPASNFKNYINELIQFCNQNNITLLRTIGVIFSDSEKRSTQYVK